MQYGFILSEFDLYPLGLDAKEVWFKLIHQILTVRHLMFKYKIINTPVSALCGLQIETFEHLFVTCASVQSLKDHAVS
jgi:hypothetical protein